MDLSTISIELETILAALQPEQRASLFEAPLVERLDKYAAYAGLNQSQALEHIAQAAGLEIKTLWDIHPEPTSLIPLRLIHEYQCLPIADQEEGSSLGSKAIKLVTLWPPAPAMGAWIYALTGRQAIWYLSRPHSVAQKITQSFGVGAGSLDATGFEGMEDTQSETIEAEDENAAIIRFVNEIIAKAIADRTTDIHFEPQKETLHIRFRIDGELVPVSLPANMDRYQAAIVSRLKIMARLNISEKRRPQDGRITYENGNEKLDIRVSTLPTMYGESISLRLLSQKSSPLSIQELGYFQEDEALIARVLQRPHGIILVTGPTGSGKSTTLTAFIRKVRSPEVRIMTVEDPIEYEVAGVNQTQVHPEIGLTFASSLRHILRQDPDVIMVGEIRDRETADIAIRAALTGHLVLSTLHTNDAPGALTRLIDMEIEPFLIASSVEMIIAQRLVRRLCQHCHQPAHFEPGYLQTCLQTLGLPPSEAQFASLVREAQGCEACRRLGYRGRIAIYEILRISEKVHEHIVHKASARVIRDEAIKENMRTLQRCGWEQVKLGLTSLSELMQFADIMQEH